MGWRHLDNRAVNRLIQAKLKVGPAGDLYEQEADHTANIVIQMPSVSKQRQTDEQEVPNQISIQPDYTTGGAPALGG